MELNSQSFSIKDILGLHDNNLDNNENMTNEELSDTVIEEEQSALEGGKDLTKEKETGKKDRQTPSYTSIIAQSILSSTENKLSLGAIYQYITENFPEFLKKGQGWRNCVRHNLSLSECFVKAGRASNGRGNYWGIHTRYLKNFSKGDYRKRRASNRPRNKDFQYSMHRYCEYYGIPYFSSQLYQNKHSVNYTQQVTKPKFSIDDILSNKNDHSEKYKLQVKIEEHKLENYPSPYSRVLLKDSAHHYNTVKGKCSCPQHYINYQTYENKKLY